MVKEAALIRVFVSGPEDMAAGRQAVKEAADELNQISLQDRGVRLEVFSWETAGSPDFGTDPQAVLNRQLKDFDIYIGLMGHRFGSPTPRAGSGTEEEFNLAYKRWKADNRSCRIMFYLDEAPVAPSILDPDELRKVKEFRARLGGLGGLYWTYNSASGDLPRYIRRHLLEAAKTYGRDWGPRWDKISHEVKSGAPSGERGQLDYAVDAEEALLSAGRSLGMIATSIEQMSRELHPADLRVTTLKQSGTLTASAALEGARAVSSAVLAMAARVDTELPNMAQSWTTFRENVMVALGAVAGPETLEEREDLRRVEALLGTGRLPLSDTRAGVCTLRTELQKLGSFSRDLREAGRRADASLAAFATEIERELRGISEVESAVRAKLGSK